MRGRTADPGRNPLPGPGQNPDRHRFHDGLPILPEVQLRQVIGAHQPDKAHLWIKAPQVPKGLGGVTRAKLRLDPRDLHPRMPHDRPRMCQPILERRGSAGLQRIAGRHQPPHPVQSEPLQRFARDVRVPRMGRIEGAAQKADHLTGCCKRNVMSKHARSPQ